MVVELVELVLLRARVVNLVLEEEQVLRYIANAQRLGLAHIDDTEACDRVLAAEGYPPLDRALLHAPEYADNDTLEEQILRGPKACFKYILDLRERDLLKSKAEKRRKRLEVLRAEHAECVAALAEQPFAGVSVWRRELAAWRAAVAEAAASRAARSLAGAGAGGEPAAGGAAKTTAGQITARRRLLPVASA